MCGILINFVVLRNFGPQSILQLLNHLKLLSLHVVTRTIGIIYLAYSEARSRRRREGESKSLIVYVKGEIGSKQASLAVTTLCCVVNQGPLKKWTEHSQELHHLKIHIIVCFQSIEIPKKVFGGFDKVFHVYLIKGFQTYERN